MIEALALMRAALGARPRPEHGLVIAKHHYERIGGHRDTSETEADLMRRLGRRIVMLRSAATSAWS
jgi:hypothetical protein